VFLERAELLGPEGVHLVEPRLQRHEVLGAQRVHAAAGVVFEHLHVDETSCAQHLEVPAHRGAGHAGAGSELAGPAWALAQHLDDVTSSRVRKSDEGGVKIVHATVNHLPK
jgi:hypothetical protein